MRKGRLKWFQTALVCVYVWVLLIIFVQGVNGFSRNNRTSSLGSAGASSAGAFGFFTELIGFNHAEDGSGDDQEADHSVDEQTNIQGNGTGCLGGCQVGVTFCRSGLCAVFQGNEQVGEINAADQQTDKGA